MKMTPLCVITVVTTSFIGTAWSEPTLCDEEITPGCVTYLKENNFLVVDNGNKGVFKLDALKVYDRVSGCDFEWTGKPTGCNCDDFEILYMGVLNSGDKVTYRDEAIEDVRWEGCAPNNNDDLKCRLKGCKEEE